MSKRKSKNDIYNMPYLDFVNNKDKFLKEIENNPEYSLEPDPTGAYNMSLEQKAFIKNYIEFKNIPLACKLSNIENDLGITYYNRIDTQQEMERINLARAKRQFNQKLLNFDEIGGYLTSLLLDQNIPTADKLTTRDKMQVVRLIIDLNKTKEDYRLKQLEMNTSSSGENISLDLQLKNLSMKSLQSLIKNSNEKDEVDVIDAEASLTKDEKDELSKLSNDELIRKINDLEDLKKQ